MSLLFIDIETYSGASLVDCGVHKYVEDDDFDILLFGYAYGDDQVTVLDLTKDTLPQDLITDLYSESVTKVAHNSAFERTCIGRYLGEYLPPEQWADTMIMASSCGLPASLDSVGQALGLSEEEAKMKEGKALVRYFCIPCKPTRANGQRTKNTRETDPDKWAVFIEYNRRDVETERIIYWKIAHWMPDYSEHKLWCVDQRINDKGIKVEAKLAENAIVIGDGFKARLLQEATDISGLENPNSVSQIKTWLEDQEGIEVLSLNKKAVVDVVANLNNDACKKFMELRQQFSKSSVKKYEAVLRCVCEDGHAKGCFQFYGAATGRWAGRLIQLQNLPQNHLDDLDFTRQLVIDGDADGLEMVHPDVQSALSQLIRTVLIPEDGHRFIVADFSAIEARCIAWISNEQWRLDTFANGGDIYCASASQMFKVPVEKHGQNADLRQKGKTAELALGYGGGVGALKAFGADELGMTEEEMASMVDTWRGASPHVVALWKSLEKTAMAVIRRGTSMTSTVGGIRFDFEQGVLFMRLPSGRRIAYWGAEIGQNRFGQPTITYMSKKNQTTKKWERIDTFGGKLAENLTQACARDVLKEAMLNLTKAGFDIRGHVHDEVIITEPIGGRSVDDVVKIMCLNAKWNEGLPLNADGYECTSYRKD